MTSTALARRLALVFFLALLMAVPAARAQEAMPIAEARDQGVGTTVTVEGTVTRAFDSFVRLQDASGPTGAAALVIRQTAPAEGTRPFRQEILDGTVAAGTQLRVTGTLSAFNGLLQINGDDLEAYTVQGQGAVPAPQTITVQNFLENGGDYESELVRIPGLRFSAPPGDVFEAGTSYTVTDGTASGAFRVQNADETALIGEPVPAEAFTYTGVAGVFFPDYFDAPSYQLLPVRPGDLTPSAAVHIIGRPYALAYEDGGAPSATLTLRASGLEGDATVTLSLRAGSPATADDVDDFGGTRQLTFSGPDPSSQTVTFTAAGDGATEGVEPLELALSTDADSVSAAGTFTLWLLDDPAAQTTLYPDLEGQALRAQLRADFASGADGVVGPPTLSYDVARDTLYSVVFNDGGLVRGYYTGYEAPLDGGDPSQDVGDEDVNTEHIWPQSRGAENEPARSNMHILVPTWAPANGARCNYPYAEINDDETERWFGASGSMGEVLDAPPALDGRDAYSESVGDDCPPSADGRFEPREVVKGDVARKALYFAMAYPTRADGPFLNVQKNVLRQWNAQDPVDADEQRRNVLVASYQGHALNPFQLDSTLVRRAFFSEEEGTLPVNITRTFGDPDAPTGYRLVALPGDANRPLAATLDGQGGADWQAYWDDGTAEDFFLPWTDADPFTFQPGRGFWLIAETPWRVQDALPAVEREADGSYAVPLDHEGWNIISNPLADGVAWSVVEAANGGTLQPLWRFDGAYAQAGTFASATRGEAFYFLNNSGLDALVLPAPGEPAALAQRAPWEAAQATTLSTYQDGRRTSTARVGLAPGAAAGLDPHDAFAPPGRFEAARLRLPVPGDGDAPERAQWLAREVRAPGADGYAFDLVLRAAPGTPVTLRAGGLQAFAEGDDVHLQDATGTAHDLRAEASVRIVPEQETTRLRLLIGSAARAGESPGLPDEVTLRPGYPNPFREKTTLQYALPNASDVRLTVYDLLGRRVLVLADEGRQAAGPHTVQWDGRGAAGRPVTSGAYFVRLEAGGAVRTQKLVRIR